LVVLLVVLLILFGPQKLPEIGQQLGRAIRDLKRATSELQNSINVDDRYESSYHPPSYDTYGNSYDTGSSGTQPEEETWRPTPEIDALPAACEPEGPRGDFASAAMAGASGDYGVENGSAPFESGPAEPSANYPEGTVPRSK
jgi:TatA/E family protein of Tat protein translocase